MKKTFKQFLNEKNENKYKEIEFVCHNSNSKTSSNKKDLFKLYSDLKELMKETDYKILPYMQDFSDDYHQEISIAVIILDKDNEQKLEEQIMKLANKHNINFDLYLEAEQWKVDEIIKGDYDNLFKFSNINI